MKNKLPLPVYRHSKIGGPPHSPVWKSEAKVNDYICSAEGKSIKDAHEKVAVQMYKDLTKGKKSKKSPYKRPASLPVDYEMNFMDTQATPCPSIPLVKVETPPGVSVYEETIKILFVDIDNHTLKTIKNYQEQGYIVHTFSRLDCFIEDGGKCIRHDLPYQCDELTMILAVAFVAGKISNEFKDDKVLMFKFLTPESDKFQCLYDL